MLMVEPTNEMLENWMELWKEYKDKITPDRKNGREIVEYIKGKYPVREIESINGQDICREVSFEIKGNDYSAWRLPVGKSPEVKAFVIENEGDGSRLYDGQDDIFKGLDIIAAVDLVTGYCHIENSSLLYDEVVAFQGLDDIDILNCYLVAEYVECRRRFGLAIE